MDPKHSFFDRRLSAAGCVLCGARSSLTREHTPAVCLLDQPLPPNLGTVRSCLTCNASFERDEAYVACLVECSRLGTTEPNLVEREVVRRRLTESPGLRARLNEALQKSLFGETEVTFEADRVSRVLRKLAISHLYYELEESVRDREISVRYRLLPQLYPSERSDLESPRPSTVFPEIGTRRFLSTSTELFSENGWLTIQPGRYRFWVNLNPLEVRAVLSEHLVGYVAIL